MADAPDATDALLQTCSSDDELRGRWLWKAMPWAKYTCCAVCSEFGYCHGKSNERLICLGCFTDDGNTAKLRRGGRVGRRSGYAYTQRRPKDGMIRLVRAMRDEGKVVGLIADELGLSEKTVKNYLAESRRSEKCAASSLPERGPIPRKEEPGQSPAAVSEVR
jgi:hypothetical protein